MGGTPSYTPRYYQSHADQQFYKSGHTNADKSQRESEKKKVNELNQNRVHVDRGDSTTFGLKEQSKYAVCKYLVDYKDRWSSQQSPDCIESTDSHNVRLLNNQLMISKDQFTSSHNQKSVLQNSNHSVENTSGSGIQLSHPILNIETPKVSNPKNY